MGGSSSKPFKIFKSDSVISTVKEMVKS